MSTKLKALDEFGPLRVLPTHGIVPRLPLDHALRYKAPEEKNGLDVLYSNHR